MEPNFKIYFLVVGLIAIPFNEAVPVKTTSMSMSTSQLPPLYKSLVGNNNNNNAGESGVANDKPASSDTTELPKDSAAQSKQGYPTQSPFPPPNTNNFDIYNQFKGHMDRPWDRDHTHEERRRYEDHSEVAWDKTGNIEQNRQWEAFQHPPGAMDRFNGSYFGPAGPGIPLDFDKSSVSTNFARNDLTETGLSSAKPKKPKTLMERYKDFHRGIDEINMQKENGDMRKFNNKNFKQSKGKAKFNSMYDAMKLKKNNAMGLDEFIRKKFQQKKQPKKASPDSFGAGNKVPLSKPHKYKTTPFDTAILNHKTLATKHNVRKQEKISPTMQQFRKTMMEQHKFKHQPENLRNVHGHNVFGNGHHNQKLTASSLVKLGDKEQKSLLEKKKDLMEHVRSRAMQNSNLKKNRPFLGNGNGQRTMRVEKNNGVNI